jgi:hypothetical protein
MMSAIMAAVAPIAMTQSIFLGSELRSRKYIPRTIPMATMHPIIRAIVFIDIPASSKQYTLLRYLNTQENCER